MTPTRALRSNPHFAHLFAHVHPLCWWVLWWNLNCLLDWYETSGYEEILYSTNRWGIIRIAYLGDRIPDPSAYRPYVLEKPRWDDPVWAMSAPAALVDIATTETLRSGGLRGSEIALRLGKDGRFASRRKGHAPSPHTTRPNPPVIPAKAGPDEAQRKAASGSGFRRD